MAKWLLTGEAAEREPVCISAPEPDYVLGDDEVLAAARAGQAADGAAFELLAHDQADPGGLARVLDAAAGSGLRAGSIHVVCKLLGTAPTQPKRRRRARKKKSGAGAAPAPEPEPELEEGEEAKEAGFASAVAALCRLVEASAVSLEAFCVSSSRLSDADWAGLSASLSLCRRLRYLSTTWNQYHCTGAAPDAISLVAAGLPRLEELVLSPVSRGKADLALALAAAPLVRLFGGSVVWDELAAAVEAAPDTLRGLTVDVSVGPAPAGAMARLVGACARLRTVGLTGPVLDDDPAEALAALPDALAAGNIRELRMSREVSPAQWLALAAAVAAHEGRGRVALRTLRKGGEMPAHVARELMLACPLLHDCDGVVGDDPDLAAVAAANRARAAAPRGRAQEDCC